MGPPEFTLSRLTVIDSGQMLLRIIHSEPAVFCQGAEPLPFWFTRGQAVC